MILRRIAHHLQQQQWTAVLVELVILVLGVFPGFQVTDWANERASIAAEARHAWKKSPRTCARAQQCSTRFGRLPRCASAASITSWAKPAA